MLLHGDSARPESLSWDEGGAVVRRNVAETAWNGTCFGSADGLELAIDATARESRRRSSVGGALMSTESAKAFLEEIDSDAKLREKLLERGCARADRVALSADQLIEFGKERGYEFSSAELRRAYAERGGQAAGELAENELDAVAGGKAAFQDFHFTHNVDKASPVLL
jgi:predicted ribosomally synthesized peptide with nif11-like leader